MMPSSPRQLGLFEEDFDPESGNAYGKASEDSLVIEPVPYRLQIEEGRFWIVVRGKYASFQIPVQWRRWEAAHLIHEIRGVSWQLNGVGIPIAYDEILRICEEFVDKKNEQSR